MDSQCKYAVLARGEASIYLRFTTDPNYKEKIWDHAAGSLLVEEAGGFVSDSKGRPLDFTKGRTLPNKGIIATNKVLYERVLGVVQFILYPPSLTFQVSIIGKNPSLSTVQQVLASRLSLNPSLIIVQPAPELSTNSTAISE